MNKFAVVFACVLLMSVSLVLAEEPYIQNGVIATPIVVGSQAPATDILLGTQIITYLQQSASRTTTGLSQTSDQVDLSDGQMILLGTPTNNPLVAEQLALGPSTLLEGPYVREFDNEVTVITGNTDAQVREAVRLFTSGTRRAGSVELTSPPTPPRVRALPEVDDEVIVGYDESQEQIDPPSMQLESGSQDTADKELCKQEAYCDSDTAKLTTLDCVDITVAQCEHGCAQGVCKEPSFWNALAEFLFFWR